MKKYDVIIVGAGPAGLQCARELAKENLQILVVEKQKEIGEPNFSTAGTPEETMKVFGLPSNLAPYKWTSLYIKSANQELLAKMKKNTGYVFDFRKLRQWLAEDAAKNGAEIAVGVTIKEPVFENKKIVGLNYQGITSSGQLKAKVYIDASGSSMILSHYPELIKPAKRESAIGLELELMNLTFPNKECLYFYLGDSYIPNGYAWIFPLSDSTAKVGVGRHTGIGVKFDMEQGLKDFINKIPWLKTGQSLEFHSGVLVYSFDVKNFVNDNFMTIGTSGNHINPLGGEGIRHGMYAAHFAAETLKDAFKNNDFSAKSLGKFNDLWNDYYSKNNWKKCDMWARLYYSNTNDKRIDQTVSDMKSLNGDEIFEFLFNYNFLSIAPKMTLEAFKNAISQIKV